LNLFELLKCEINNFFVFFSTFKDSNPFSSQNRLVHGFSWSIVGTIILNIFGLISTIITARLLGISTYGEYAIIQSTVGLFSILAGLGLGLTATKYIGEYRAKDHEKVLRIITVSVALAIISGSILSVILLIFAPFLSIHILHSPDLAVSLQLSAGLLFLGALNGAILGILSGFSEFKKIALINMFVGIITIPIFIVLIIFLDLPGAIIAAELIMLINVLIGYRMIRTVCNYRKPIMNFHIFKNEFFLLSQFSIPAIASNLVCGLGIWVASVILINQPDGYSQIAIYNAAYQWRIVVIFIPGILSQVSIPILAEDYGEREIVNISSFIQEMTLLIGIYSLLVMIFLSIFSQQIMGLYGSSFSDGWTVLIVVLLTAMIYAILLPVSNVIIASGRMWIGFLLNSGWALILLISTIYLIKYGSLGLATAFLIAYVFHGSWTFLYSRYILMKK
jgi:O-antigen/teichoic acid export membrane protein